MFFFKFSNVNVLFAQQELTWSLYIPIKVLPRTKEVQIIGQKKFANTALNSSKEAFIIYMAHLNSKILKHAAHKAQIALLVFKKNNYFSQIVELIRYHLKKISC